MNGSPSKRLALHELPEEALVAWDRDMAHEPWNSEAVEFYECPYPREPPARITAWTPCYKANDAQLAAYIYEEQRWYRFSHCAPFYGSDWKLAAIV